jgi:hypothetical protein
MPPETGAQNPREREDWVAALDAYSVRFLILDVRRDNDLWQRIRVEPGWTVDFQDRDAVLLTRTWAGT